MSPSKFTSSSRDCGSTLDQSISVTTSDDLDGSLARVRSGAVAAVVTQDGATVDVHYSRADQVRAAQVLVVDPPSGPTA